MDALFSLVFDLSRSEQHRIIAGGSPLKRQISLALANTSAQFPIRPTVACQGAEGANSQMACERIFPSGSIIYLLAWKSGVKTIYYIRSKSLEIEECEVCSS